MNPPAPLPVLREKAASLKWAIALSSFLCAMKAAAAFFCSSQSLFASALDSLLDVGMSSVNYVSVLKASKPPDEDHAYGHQKIESLASFAQGIVILLGALFIMAESLRRTLVRVRVTHSAAALGVIAISLAINFIITAILGRAEKATRSIVLKAEKTHYSMDILSYVMIFAALALVRVTGWSGWDVLGGVAVAGYVGYLAAQILTQAGSELVDRALPQSDLDELDRLIRSHDSHVLSYHEMRTRKAGDKVFIDFHLVMRHDQSFSQAHELTESLIQKIKTRFPEADITVHEDPEGGM